MRFNLRNVTGNALMAFSLFLLLFIYYPVIALYIFPQRPDQTILNKGFYIEIPKINVLSEVIENVDPFNETEYREKLKEGVAHAKNTSLPGVQGKMFLFAHSSDSPWSITRYNVAFFRLPELKPGDEINIGKNGKTFRYRVYDTKTVSPLEVSYLKNTGENELILQTCVPIGSSLQRLLVFSRLI